MTSTEPRDTHDASPAPAAANATNDTGFTGPARALIAEHLRLLPRYLFPREKTAHAGPGSSWWDRPGIGITYQIEYRPGWEWERDFAVFNESMTDPATGGIAFDGPFCDVQNFMEVSKAAHVDYHTFESKWHDGICYFETSTTRWTADKDYASEFARLSRAEGIPFLFYYSSAVDHNPQFDAVQPDRHATLSLIGYQEGAYTEYLQRQYADPATYEPDGMWFDWFWPDHSASTTIRWFQRHSPGTVVTFNISNLYPSRAKELTYTAGEVHGLDGQPFGLVDGVRLPTSAWFWSRWYRRVLDKPWELLTPAGKGWQRPELRDDPDELLRMAAIILAAGGKIHVGATVELSGRVDDAQAGQLARLGAFYAGRKQLYRDATPIRRWRKRGNRARIAGKAGFVSLGSRLGDDILVHVINMTGADEGVSLTVALSGFTPERIVVEPTGEELAFTVRRGRVHIDIPRHLVDRVATILRLTNH